MRLVTGRRGIILVLAALLQSCGGGGGGGGAPPGAGNPPPPAPGTNARVTFSTTSVAVTATPGNLAPIRNVILTVTNPPPNGLYVEGGYTANGIEVLDFSSNSPTQGTLIIRFRSPGSLQNGTYSDTIQIRVCTDDTCTAQIAGSPTTIAVAYTVSGTGTSVATIDRSSMSLAVDANDQMPRTESAVIVLTPQSASQVRVVVNAASPAIREARYLSLDNITFHVDVEFHTGQGLGPGTYAGNVTVMVCYDSSCVRQVQGSPFTIQTTMTVSEGPEPGVTPLAVTSRVALPHNVVDAEFSKARNQLVMVATYPANALYVYDVATGTEQQQALAQAPSSVSISPDGQTAAVGHDARISVVDLAGVGQAGAPPLVLLDVATNVYDVVLDGHGYVHAWSRFGSWVEIHSVEISTNTGQLNTGRSIYGGARGRLHPSGDFLYTANNGLSPDDIEKWDIRQGRADWLYDSPYHGDYAMCGNLWFDEAGEIIYTACGNTFRSSTTQAQDMTYAGALQLTERNFNRYTVRSLSQSAALGEIALLEYDFLACEGLSSASPCYFHLAYYESEFRNRLALYSLAPVTVDGATYGQRGLFLFHDAIGTNKYLISRLARIANPDAEYYLSVVP